MRVAQQQQFSYSSLDTRWLPFGSAFPKTLTIFIAMAGFTAWRLMQHPWLTPNIEDIMLAICVVALYTIAQFVPFQIHQTNKPVTFALTHYPFVVGVLLLEPWLMCAAATFSTLGPYFAGRRSFDRTVFSAGLLAFEVAIATTILDWTHPSRAIDPNEWLKVLGLVAATFVISVVANTLHSAWQFKEKPDFPSPSTTGIFALAAVMAATAGVISAACLHDSLWPSPLIVAFMCALVKAYSIRQETTRRSRILTKFRNRTQDTSITEDEVLNTLLDEACQITNARKAWIDFTTSEVQDNIRIVHNGGPPIHGLNLFGLRRDRATVVAPMKRSDGRSARLILADKDPEWGDFTAADAATLEPLIGHAENKWRSSLLLSQIQHDSQFDDVTGIGNREYFVKAIESISEPTIVAQVRCKTLPRVITAFGISVGNELAKELARRITDAVSLCPSGISARIADETFGFMIPGTAVQEMDNIMAVMEAPLSHGPVAVNLSYSAGYTLVRPGTPAVEVLHQSHSALTTAMTENSSEVIEYRPADVHKMRHRMSLAEDLRTALQQGNITTAFQPKLNAETGIVCGFEALARWHHPRHGQIRPDEFTAIAEQTDQIRDLTQAVLRHALRACHRWQSVRPGVGVSINASTRDLMSTEFAQSVEHALHQAGLPSSLLTIEVTETDVISDPDAAVATLLALREAGVTVSVDDFGTGYSSLAYLQTLPIDEAKIDKSFIMQLDDDPTGRQFVARIISLMHSLNIAVTAEGVESAQTAKFLSSAGCDTLQGYYIARALPAHSVSTWLRDHGSSMIPGLDDQGDHTDTTGQGEGHVYPSSGRMPMPRAASDEVVSSLELESDAPKPLTLAELDAGHVRDGNGIDPRSGSRSKAKRIPSAPPIAANAFLQGVTIDKEITDVTAQQPSSPGAPETSDEAAQSFVLGPPSLPKRPAAQNIGEPVQLVSSTPETRSASSLPPAALATGRARAVFEAEAAQAQPATTQPVTTQAASQPTPLMEVPAEHAPLIPGQRLPGSAVDAATAPQLHTAPQPTAPPQIQEPSQLETLAQLETPTQLEAPAQSAPPMPGVPPTPSSTSAESTTPAEVPQSSTAPDSHAESTTPVFTSLGVPAVPEAASGSPTNATLQEIPDEGVSDDFSDFWSAPTSTAPESAVAPEPAVASESVLAPESAATPARNDSLLAKAPVQQTPAVAYPSPIMVTSQEPTTPSASGTPLHDELVSAALRSEKTTLRSEKTAQRSDQTTLRTDEAVLLSDRTPDAPAEVCDEAAPADDSPGGFFTF